jgi:hypothetical protein
MNRARNCHDNHSWTTEITRVDLLYHAFIHYPPLNNQSENCCKSCELGLVPCFLSFILWSVIAVLVGYITVAHIDQERIEEIDRQVRDRLDCVLRGITVKVSLSTNQIDILSCRFKKIAPLILLNTAPWWSFVLE